MKIVVSGNLMRYTDYQKEIELSASTVRGALDVLVEQHPALKQVLIDANGGVRMVHRLHLNGEVLQADELDRSVAASDEVGILTALAGG